MKTILIALLLFCNLAQARDIRVIVPYSPGGSTDRLARILSVRLSSPEYNFVVDYRLGGAGSVAANYVAENKKETVVMITSNGFISNPLINHVDRYDPERDFVLVSYLGAEPLLISVTVASRIKNFKEFLKLLDSQQMSYGSSGVGSSSHFAGAVVANNRSTVVHVPYKGGSAAMQDFLFGRISWMTESSSVMDPYIESGSVRPLAVFYHRRLAQYPKLPTVKEFGINDRDFYRWHIMVANTSADPDVIKYLQKRLQEPGIKNLIESLGIDTAAVKNPDNFFKNETVKIQQIIKDFKITE